MLQRARLHGDGGHRQGNVGRRAWRATGPTGLFPLLLCHPGDPALAGMAQGTAHRAAHLPPDGAFLSRDCRHLGHGAELLGAVAAAFPGSHRHRLCRTPAGRGLRGDVSGRERPAVPAVHGGARSFRGADRTVATTWPAWGRGRFPPYARRRGGACRRGLCGTGAGFRAQDGAAGTDLRHRFLVFGHLLGAWSADIAFRLGPARCDDIGAADRDRASGWDRADPADIGLSLRRSLADRAFRICLDAAFRRHRLVPV